MGGCFGLAWRAGERARECYLNLYTNIKSTRNLFYEIRANIIMYFLFQRGIFQADNNTYGLEPDTKEDITSNEVIHGLFEIHEQTDFKTDFVIPGNLTTDLRIDCGFMYVNVLVSTLFERLANCVNVIRCV